MSAARRLIALLVVLAPQSASAHLIFGGAGGFSGGLLHPLFVPAHVMAVTAIAAFIAQRHPQWSWSTHGLNPMAFVLGLIAGIVAIAGAFVPLYANEFVLALAAVTGALLALAAPLPRVLLGALAAATGFAIAIDSPPDVISLRDAIVIQLGTFCGAIILLAAVIEIVSRLRRGWQRVGVRIAGSWIAASAALVLAVQLFK